MHLLVQHGLLVQPRRLRPLLRADARRNQRLRLPHELRLQPEHDGLGLLHERVLRLQHDRRLRVGYYLRSDVLLLPLSSRG